jgi:hypothetical protein
MPAAPVETPVHLAPVSSAAAQFAAAASSLERGQGPAGGLPIGCTVNAGGVSGLCGAANLTRPSPILPNGAGAPSPRIPSGGTPGPLFGAAMAYDGSSAVQAVVLFGGAKSNGYVSDATWSFVGGSWTNDTPYFPGPSPRWDAAMTYDFQDGYLLLYGGCAQAPTAGFCPLAQDQAFTLTGGGWTQIPATNSNGVGPGPLYDAALCDDTADGYVLLFGGSTGQFNVVPPMGGGPPPPPKFIIRPQGSTWSFLAGSWTNITTGAGPSARYGARMVYDPTLSAVVLFGGTNRTEVVTGAVDADTWEFTGGTWSQLHSRSAPDARWDTLLIYNPLTGNLLLFGGAVVQGTAADDEWQLHSAFVGWTQLLPIQPPVSGVPGPRYNAVATFDGFDGYMLLFGGQTPSGSAFSDDWIGTNTSWTELSTGAPFPTGPTARWGEGLTFLPGILSGTGEGVLFGGQQCTSSRCLDLGDTWLFSQGVWSKQTPKAAPSARYGAAMAAYPPGGYVLLFGGCGIVCPLGDTWKYEAGRWTLLHPPSSPSPRYFASLSYDAKDGFDILFGGCLGGHTVCPASDTWVWDEGQWINITGSLSLAPPGRFGAGVDTSSGDALLYGGMGASGPLSDTWWFWNLTWLALPLGQTGPPPAVVFPTFSYDVGASELLLWAGCAPQGCPTGEAFVYPFNGTFPGSIPPPPPPAPPPPAIGWTPWLPSLTWLPPAPTSGSTGIWDPADGPMGYVLFFGGRTLSGATTGETAQFTGGAWNLLGPWV